MTAVLRALACLLLSGTTALAGSDLDLALAGAPRLRAAAEAACDLTDLIMDTTYEGSDGFAMTPRAVDAKKSADWLYRYSLFAVSGHGALLADYAHLLTQWKGPESRLKDAECRVLMPAYDVAMTTGHVLEPPAAVFASPLVGKEPDGLKIDAAIAAVAQRCETNEHETRYIAWCRKGPNGMRGETPFRASLERSSGHLHHLRPR